MKGFIAFLLIVLIGASLWNTMELKGVKQDIAELKRKGNLRDEQAAENQNLAKAAMLLAQAREAIAKTDMSRARAAMDDARVQINRAAENASAAAKPALDWIQSEYKSVSGEVKRRINDR